MKHNHPILLNGRSKAQSLFMRSQCYRYNPNLLNLSLGSASSTRSFHQTGKAAIQKSNQEFGLNSKFNLYKLNFQYFLYFTLPILHKKLVIGWLILGFLFNIFFIIIHWILPFFLYSLAFLITVWSESDKLILLIGYFINDCASCDICAIFPFFLDNLIFNFQLFYIIFSSDNYLPLLADSYLGDYLASASQGSEPSVAQHQEGGALAVPTLLASNTANNDQPEPAGSSSAPVGEGGWQPVPASERLENYEGMHHWENSNPNRNHPAIRQFNRYKEDFTTSFSVRECAKRNTLVHDLMYWGDQLYALNFHRKATEGHKLAIFATRLSIEHLLNWKDTNNN